MIANIGDRDAEAARELFAHARTVAKALRHFCQEARTAVGGERDWIDRLLTCVYAIEKTVRTLDGTSD
jgi:hypothetical protein